MADLLPNCLGRIPRVDYHVNLPGIWYYLYCANCGIPAYRVMATELPAEYAFALCNNCVETWGEPAGVTKCPTEVFAKKVQDVMVEEYGHQLNHTEILVELEDPTSVVSKLEKEALRR